MYLKIYMLYKKKCSELNILSVKEHMYRYIFNRCFNLHFKALRKNTCKRYEYKIILNTKEYKIKLNIKKNSDREIIKKLEDEYYIYKK